MKRILCLLAVLYFLPIQPILSAEPPRLDCFGDPLPKGAVARMGTVRFRHAGPVQTVAYSPDGKIIASAGPDIRFWDAETGKCLRVLDEHRGAISQLAYSPDGKRLVSASYDATARLWDPATGKQMWCIKFPDEVRNAAFSPDGKVLAIGGRRMGIYILDAATGKERRRLRGDSALFSLAFSPGGQTLASGDNAQDQPNICIWDWKIGRPVRRIGPRGSEAVLALAFSPDGKTLAAGGRFRLWDVATGKEQPALEDAPISASILAFSPNSKLLAVGGGYDGVPGVRVWDLSTRKKVSSTETDDYQDFDLVFSPDGKTLASADGDGRVRLWEPAGDRNCRSLGEVHCDEIRSISVSPDGKTLATASPNAVFRLWELKTGKPIRALKKAGQVRWSPSVSVVYSPDGKRLATGLRDGITLWDPATGRQEGEIKGPEGLVDLAFSPDGQTLLSSGHDDEGPHLWEVRTGNEIARFVRPKGVGGSIAFAPDGIAIASIWQGTVLWDRENGERLYSWESPENGQVTFSPDGRLLAAVGRDHVWVRDLLSDRLLFEMKTGENQKRAEGSNYYAGLAISPDGRFFAVGSWATVLVWELATGRKLCTFDGHLGKVLAVAFTPDGKHLVSASEDSTALVWDISSLSGKKLDLPLLDQSSIEWQWAYWRPPDPRRAYRAFQSLAAQPGTVVPFLNKRLQKATVPVAIAGLVADLSNNRFSVRKRATDELEKLGFHAEPALSRARANKPSLEMSRRLDQLIEKVETLPETWRMRRAVKLLGWINTAEARQVLEALAAGEPAAIQTREAKAALKRPVRRVP